MSGRFLAEALIVSVAGVVLIVILGLRYINGNITESNASSNPVLNIVSSTPFWISLFLVILVCIGAIELYYRRAGSASRNTDRFSISKERVFLTD